jgi:competence protein ComFB
MNFEQIHNYYEQLVMRHILETLVRPGESPDEDYLEDVACVALNQLPARYVRHEVDLAFYMPAQERLQMQEAVRDAVESAARFVARHRDENRPLTLTMEST